MMKVVSAGDESDIHPKLRRLHTLLFGSEAALAAKDSETALGLALRLLGFLESECKTDEDEVYVRKMLKVVHATIDTARRSLNPERENQERTKSLETRFCASSSSIDLHRIKNSKYFSPICRTQHTESHGVSSKCVNTIESLPAASAKATPIVLGLEPQKGPERSAPTPARGVVQSKITDYGGNSSKQLGNQYLNGAKPSEICQAPSTVGTSHGITELVSKAATSKSVARQTAEIVDGDFLPSPDEEDDDKSLWTSYGGGRKRGRNPYLNKKVQNKIRRGLRDGDSDEDSEAVTRVSYSTRNKHAAIKQLKKKQDSGSESDGDEEAVLNTFVTAKQKWATESLSKRISYSSQGGNNPYQNGGGVPNNLRNGGAKSLGVRRGVRSSFIPPVRFNGGSTSGAAAAAVPRQQTGVESGAEDSTKKCLELLVGPDGELPERLRNLEPKLIEHVSNEIMEQDPNVRWDDIAGLEHAKKCVTEMVIWPLLRPDIFQGCRAPGKGLLLFGPPGTGKTMIGKAIAGEAKATFFSISASSLTSKWIGEGEKLVRALFGVASCRQPAVIFIDEVDSLLSQRKADGEHESSRRLKTQFLIEMEGCGSGTEQILLIGATNRPQELDEAARRRLSKRLYIPLPSAEARAWIVRSLLKKDGLMTLSDDEVHAICTSTDGYSGSDMKHLVKEASMGPLREALMQGKDISKISKDEMRPISLEDFTCALQQVRPSVSPSELGLYEDWNRQFGSLAL